MQSFLLKNISLYYSYDRLISELKMVQWLLVIITIPTLFNFLLYVWIWLNKLFYIFTIEIIIIICKSKNIISRKEIQKRWGEGNAFGVIKNINEYTWMGTSYIVLKLMIIIINILWIYIKIYSYYHGSMVWLPDVQSKLQKQSKSISYKMQYQIFFLSSL